MRNYRNEYLFQNIKYQQERGRRQDNAFARRTEPPVWRISAKRTLQYARPQILGRQGFDGPTEMQKH